MRKPLHNTGVFKLQNIFFITSDVSENINIKLGAFIKFVTNVDCYEHKHLETPAPAQPGGGRVVLGKLPVPGRPTIWITVGQGPTALVVSVGGGCLDIFTLVYPFLFPFSLSLGDGPI